MIGKTFHSLRTGRTMHVGMMVCCAVMLLPLAGFFAAGGTLAGLWTNAAAFAPLGLCLGAHLVMHKMMGRSCHGAGKEAAAEPAAVGPYPAAASDDRLQPAAAR